MKSDRSSGLSRQGLKVFFLTLVCFMVMLGVAYMNRYRTQTRIEEEYVINGDLPRHVLFEAMPEGEAEKTAALFMKYQGLGQSELWKKLLAEDLRDPAVLAGQEEEAGFYIRELVVHEIQTLAEEDLGERKAEYDALKTVCGYEEYRTVRISYTRSCAARPDQAGSQEELQKEEAYTRDFAVGKKAGAGEKWEIFFLAPAI